MTRSPSDPSSHIQGEKPGAGAAPAANADAPVAPSAAGGGRLSFGWRLALFLWATSFVFLWLYELLAAVRRALTASE